MRFCNKLTVILSLSTVILTIFLLQNFHRTSISTVNRSKSPELSKVIGSYTCRTWNELPYINVSKYQTCLSSTRDEGFWPVESIRHTAYKGLLNSSSLIVEVGGNIGLDTEKFVALYNCSIISYEPLRSMSDNLVKKFQTNGKVTIRPYGLGSSARTLAIRLEGADNTGTSVFQTGSLLNNSRSEQIELLNIIDEIQSIRKNRTANGMIDLITINCEGCEFEILPALARANLTQYFRIIQFSTHIKLVDETSCIYCQIQQALERTHRVKYRYNLLWEGWVRNEV